MMQGIVDQNCEATIRLVVGNLDSQRQMIDAVIDTGFTWQYIWTSPIHKYQKVNKTLTAGRF